MRADNQLDGLALVGVRQRRTVTTHIDSTANHRRCNLGGVIRTFLIFLTYHADGYALGIGAVGIQRLHRTVVVIGSLEVTIVIVTIRQFVLQRRIVGIWI